MLKRISGILSASNLFQYSFSLNRDFATEQNQINFQGINDNTTTEWMKSPLTVVIYMYVNLGRKKWPEEKWMTLMIILKIDQLHLRSCSIHALISNSISLFLSLSCSVILCAQIISTSNQFKCTWWYCVHCQ